MWTCTKRASYVQMHKESMSCQQIIHPMSACPHILPARAQRYRNTTMSATRMIMQAVTSSAPNEGAGAECRAGVAGLGDENLAVQVVRVPCAVHADSGAIFHERKCPIPTPLVYKRLVPAVHRFLPCHTPACMWACWCRPRSCHK